MFKALSTEEFKSALPAQFKKSVNQSLIDSINSKITDEEEMEQFRDNLVGYSTVLTQGKFQLDKFADAVRYITFKVSGLSNKDAYYKTFPEKIERFVLQGVPDKDIASYYTAYNKSKLITLLYEQAMIPVWLANQDAYQKAINAQVSLLLTAKSEMVKATAANSILTHLKPPEIRKVELEINTKEDSAIAALRDTTQALIAEQRRIIESGAQTAQEVAHSQLFAAEYEDITDA